MADMNIVRLPLGAGGGVDGRRGGAGGGPESRAIGGGGAGGGLEILTIGGGGGGVLARGSGWLDSLYPQCLHRTASIGISRWHAGHVLLLLIVDRPHAGQET
jgi:hypothetical protein